MSIQFQVLGSPGRDNALFVWINSGTHIFRLLFDCGEDLLKGIKQPDVKSIDYLFFSHLHMDHIAGFDYFFRRNFDRENKPVYVWGPEGTSEILHHRMQGFMWNLTDGQPGQWYVTDIREKDTITYSYKASEGFSERRPEGKSFFNGILIDNRDFRVEAVLLNHIVPTVAYLVTEKSSLNIDKNTLEEMNIAPGPWLERLKDMSVPDDEFLPLDGTIYSVGHLREKLINVTPGDKIAYLTDFVADERSYERAVKLIKSCSTVVCESQYTSADADLAARNYHLTAPQAAQIAKDAGAGSLILFHISERYTIEEYPAILSEARDIFPASYFPEGWLRNARYPGESENR